MSLAGKLVDSPILLVATRTWQNKDNIDDKTYSKVLNTHLERYNILKKNGYDVKILGIEKGFLPKHIDAKRVWQYLDDFEDRKPESIVRVPVENHAEFLSLLWPCDIFQTYKDQIFTAPDQKGLTEKILDRLGIEGVITSSELGEGGYTIRDDNIICASEYIKGAEGLETLKDMGYNLFFLPFMTRDKAKNDGDCKLLGRMRKLQGHIDCEFNQTDLNICISPEYYKAFETEINDYLNQVNELMGTTPQIYEIPDDEVHWKAVNFRVMPDKKIILLNKCEKTAAWFRSRLGNEKVIMLPYDNIDFVYHGGPKCRSNLIE